MAQLKQSDLNINSKSKHNNPFYSRRGTIWIDFSSKTLVRNVRCDLQIYFDKFTGNKIESLKDNKTIDHGV